MQSTFKSAITLFPVGLVLAASLGGCFGGLSIEEQTQRLSQAKFSATTRYAIVARNTNTHASPRVNTMQIIVLVHDIAKIVEETLGIKAEVLPYGSDTPWSQELKRAREATGWLTSAGNEDFFRNAGYDGYVMITFNESFDWIVDPVSVRWFLTYNPVYHIFSLPKGGEKTIMLQAGARQKFRCETQGALLPFIPRDKSYQFAGPGLTPPKVLYSGLIDRKKCMDRIVKRFKKALDDRY
jgi:hypothetical protein